MAGFLGMRGTGDWATDQRPKSWRDGILFEYPNGDTPLTALTALMKSERLTDPEYYWWTKSLPSQGGAVTGVYTDTGLSNAYTSGGTAGSALYVKMAEATADEFRSGHQVLLRDSSHYDVDVNAKVEGVVKNGASSYLAVTLLEADDNGASTDLSDCDRALIVGNINPEGSTLPTAIGYDPTKWYNYAQIFRTALSITRTAKQTRLRTGDAYAEARREAAELHALEIEKALLWGIKSSGTGDNGKPERTTHGLIRAIQDGGVSDDFSLNATYSGDTWLASGETWLDAQLEEIFRYGANEKMCFAGSGAILGINRLAKSGGQIQLEPMTMEYGIQVMKWITPFGVILLKRHPLFSYETTNRNSLVIFEPKNCVYRYVQDTIFEPNKKGATLKDSIDEGFLTEAGLEYHHPTGWGYLNGVGTDNAV